MIYTLQLKSAPYHQQSHRTALSFAEALLQKGHQIKQVFYSGSAVVVANQLATAPQDELCIQSRWQSLAADHGFTLEVCSAAAIRHGVISQQEAALYKKPAHNLASGFILSGLGQLVEAINHSDRLLSFG